MKLSPSVLSIDVSAVAEQVAQRLRQLLSRSLSRRGFVVAMSGGIDSSVCAALCVRAVGKERVFGLLLPERDSSASSTYRGRQLGDHLGVRYELVDIAPTLSAIGCYSWRDDAIRAVFPEYDGTWRCKIVIDGGLEGRLNRFKLVVEPRAGEIQEAFLGVREYLQIVAATNFKQRVRKTIEYFHADRLNYAVVGTANRLEHDQGFFVKNGDGSADVKPIAHLYKSQVYALAQYMGLPEDICNAVPTTDTYSLNQGQDEFYFSLPFEQMDLALWAHNHGHPPADLAEALQISRERAAFIYADIENKRRTTRYLHSQAALIDELLEVGR